MSVSKVGHWPYSHHLLREKENNLFSKKDRLLFTSANTISVVSGKGGVGKTSFALKLSKILANEGYKVLLIDCDTNLSNTAIKLGLPINQNFYEFVTNQKEFDEVVYKDGRFHLLSACNGYLDLFKENLNWEKIIVDIMCIYENSYDFIFLDCPAGLSKKILSISAYCDYRFIVINPDKSAITDAYSLIKILDQLYGVRENHLLLNKISSMDQYTKIIKVMSGVVNNFLSSKLSVLGFVSLFKEEADNFDKELEKFSNSIIQNQFYNIIKKFIEESIRDNSCLKPKNTCLEVGFIK